MADSRLPSQSRTTPLTRAYASALLTFILVAALQFAVGIRVPLLTSVLGALQGTLLCAIPILGLFWVHGAWSRVPSPCRRAYDGRRIEPDEALWKLFIPVYGVYWLFIVNVGLCGAIERHLARAGRRATKAPSTLAFIACLVQLVPLVGVVVSPFLWSALMAQVDAVQAEAERSDAEPRPHASRGPLLTLAIIAGGAIFEWGLLIVTYVAVWQFLSPSGVQPMR